MKFDENNPLYSKGEEKKVDNTNVTYDKLNYNHYTKEQYDRDIVNAIPYHRELHQKILDDLFEKYKPKEIRDVLDLGVGTGITTQMIKDRFPNFKFDVVDFSENMLDHTRKKLGTENVNYILGDYSKIDFNKKYDVIVSVIGMHHQNNDGKKFMFKRIYDLLNVDGEFIFGDLVTYKNADEAALNQEKHFEHLKNNAADEQTYKEWEYHHKVLNDLAPIEDQEKWLLEAGFKTVERKLLEVNTALIICKK